MDWNTGKKARIRVSLRDRAAPTQKTNLPEEAQYVEGKSDGAPQRKGEIEENKLGQETDQSATEDRRLYIGNTSYAMTEDDLREHLKEYPLDDIRMPVNPRTSRPVGYAFVNLAKTSDVSQAIQQLNGTLLCGRKISVDIARKDNESKASDMGPEKSPKSVNGHALANNTGKVSASEQSTNKVAVVTGSNNTGVESGTPQSGIERERTHQGDRSDLARSSTPPSDNARQIHRYNDSDEGDASDSGSDGGVLLNVLEDDEHESGEITDSSNASADSHRQRRKHEIGFDGSMSEDASNPKGEPDSLEDGDAMMEYANSEALINDSIHRYPSSNVQSQSLQPLTLAELEQRDMELQLRYFYVNKEPGEVDLNDPVRCLVCTEKGHTAAKCGWMNCDHCRDQKAHSTFNCPKILTCSKCRQPGHSILACPSRARPPTTALTCEFCERSGHLAQDCELHWRTSGRPWESDLHDRRIRFECYECGKKGHLGNECPTRQPKKPKGSSSWTYYPQSRRIENAPNGFSIKGRAQKKQQEAILIDDSDDEMSNFYRPKISAPARSGQIKIIATQSGQTQLHSQNASSARFRGDHSGNQNQRSGERRRSRSPQRRDYYGSNDYGRYADPLSYSQAPTNYDYRTMPTYQQPPLPREPPPMYHDSYAMPAEARKSKAAEVYRPMPSSGRQAWTQFRK